MSNTSICDNTLIIFLLLAFVGSYNSQYLVGESSHSPISIQTHRLNSTQLNSTHISSINPSLSNNGETSKALVHDWPTKNSSEEVKLSTTKFKLPTEISFDIWKKKQAETVVEL